MSYPPLTPSNETYPPIVRPEPAVKLAALPRPSADEPDNMIKYPPTLTNDPPPTIVTAPPSLNNDEPD